MAGMLYKRTSEPFKGYDGTEQFVTIEPGSGTRAIGQRLIDGGVVRDDATFRAALWRSGRARSLQAGEFRFDRPMTPAEVDREDRARRRLQPAHHVSRRAHVFGRWRASTSSRGSARRRRSSRRRAIRAAIRDIDPVATDLEGYLFPETYSLPRDTTRGESSSA